MTRASPPRYRALVVPALLTSAFALLAFGLAHAAFITWMVDRSHDTSLLLRLGVMFFAPMVIGVPVGIVISLVGAAAWRLTWSSERLRSWTYGAILASSLLPPIVLALANGPLGDVAPSAPSVAVALAAMIAIPSILGAYVARSWMGIALGPAAFPFAGPWSLFILGEGLVGWVVPFVVSLVLIVLASGAVMERLTARLRSEPFSPRGDSGRT